MTKRDNLFLLGSNLLFIYVIISLFLIVISALVNNAETIDTAPRLLCMGHAERKAYCVASQSLTANLSR